MQLISGGANADEKVLDLGGADEGEPRVRSGLHSAYVRDLDGNKICFYS